MKHINDHTKTLILTEGQGRVYNCGTMTAIFKADENETNEKYSVSEWWLEPNSDGPGPLHTKKMTKYFTFWKELLHFLQAISG